MTARVTAARRSPPGMRGATAAFTTSPWHETRARPAARPPQTPASRSQAATTLPSLMPMPAPSPTTRVIFGLKLRSRWRSRFRYFFRLFPEAGLADFRIVNAVADRLPLDSIGKLEVAGNWLVRLSRLPEIGLRQRMARRWERACNLATFADARLEALRADIAAQITTAPW